MTAPAARLLLKPVYVTFASRSFVWRSQPPTKGLTPLDSPRYSTGSARFHYSEGKS